MRVHGARRSSALSGGTDVTAMLPVGVSNAGGGQRGTSVGPADLQRGRRGDPHWRAGGLPLAGPAQRAGGKRGLEPQADRGQEGRDACTVQGATYTGFRGLT